MTEGAMVHPGLASLNTSLNHERALCQQSGGQRPLLAREHSRGAGRGAEGSKAVLWEGLETGI